MPTVLLIEDDPNLGLLLSENFNNKGLKIHWCREGEEGLSAFYGNHFDLCILDIMLPKKDGFSISKEIRKINDTIPFIFLTSRSLSTDKYKGFELGCDDYVTKPFSAHELYLRVKAILKRYAPGQTRPDESFQASIGKFTFDYGKRMLANGPDERRLSSKENELLMLMASNKNKLVNRKYMMMQVWGNDDYFTSKSMDVYLTKLRKLLREDPCIELINVYGAGYKLVVQE